MIDGIVYINLDYRTDRKVSILSTIEKAGFNMEKVHRIDAVLNEMCGHIGCGMSHIKALEYAKQQKWNCTLVLEDDFIFKESKDNIQSTIDKLKDIKWDCVLLAKGHNNLIDSDYSFLKRVKYCTTTSGYIVKKDYYDKIIDNFKESVKIMNLQFEEHKQKCLNENKPVTKLNYVTAIDQYWKKLQKTDVFYLCDPVLGEQICGYSDNNCSLDHQRKTILKYKSTNS